MRLIFKTRCCKFGSCRQLFLPPTLSKHIAHINISSSTHQLTVVCDLLILYTGEQFIPRDSEIHHLVISQLPQIVTGQDCEYWLTVLQAVLGLSTAACSSHNLQSMFQHWLSGRGNGPPIWRTLLDVFENSGIRELQCIACCQKARLHGMCCCAYSLLGCLEAGTG